MNKTACPLDCFDACSVIATSEGLKGDPNHPLTQGFLCPHLNHYERHDRILQPSWRSEPITMDEAMARLIELMEQTPSHRTLHLRGRGNFGLMQAVSDHFFASRGARLTRGSLCDGAGAAGIEAGRGKNRLVDISELKKSEVVILWGRNVHVSNSHYLPLLKGKTVIVIDPIRTKAARQADLHIQIKPHGDLYLALLLSRFAMIEGLESSEYLQEFASGFEDFYELTQTVRIKAILEKIDVTLGQIGTLLELVRGKKTMILAGTGIQKYRNGAEIMRAIDGFGVLMGYFGKSGCGVNFLGDSSLDITSPFKTEAKRVPVGNIDFTDFDLLFIQGMNPLSQLPDTNRVMHQMGSVAHVVYFGLYENESSACADLVIPAKSFLEKADIRSSYGHNELLRMPQQQAGEIGISEYELTKRLCTHFGIALEDEERYLAHFESHTLHVKGRDALPYREGFDTDDGMFAFLDDVDADFDLENDLFLLTCKSPRSLNSQFFREKHVHVNPAMGYFEGQRLRLVSKNGSVELDVKLDENLRSDCVMVYSGTPGVNALTTSQLSYEGECASYQENKVKVEVC